MINLLTRFFDVLQQEKEKEKEEDKKKEIIEVNGGGRRGTSVVMKQGLGFMAC
jgi:hypothetical protein